MPMIFTVDQQKVIDLRDRNILVSAAAGSGKTAVLVERIIKMISEGEHPTDIDRLLVVTFTNMAAAQMRERISLAIGKKLETQPENEHLQRQMTLIHNAQITTIDSFCLFILRNHFNSIGLDPGFRVADEGELKLLQKDVMAEVLEEWYASGDEAFLQCVDYFSTGSSSGDWQLEEYITRLYEFSMSYPWPEEWLLNRKADYLAGSVEEIEETAWGRFLFQFIKDMTAQCTLKIEQCVRICEEPDGPYMYGTVLEDELQMLLKLREAASLSELAVLWCGITFARLPAKKDSSVSPEKREAVQGIRNMVKALLSDTGARFFSLPLEQEIRRMEKISEALGALIDVVISYRKALDRTKREKNIIDFGDMEHLALAVLLEKTAEGYRPTTAAREFQEHFTEILTDEYQDSNLVQELLLSSISGEGWGNYNRFMVGDVKQSIYKFRLARPEIFMDKYDSYTKEPFSADSVIDQAARDNAEINNSAGDNSGSRTRRIDLRQNFRSREEVIGSVNFIFRKIMGKALGGVAYNDDAALYPGAIYPPTGEAGGHPNKTELLIVNSESEIEAEVGENGKDNARRQEARAIAKRIKRLVGSFPVTDEETGTLRPACYKDMVILLRTNAGWDDEFKAVLEEEGIPSHVASKTGYFKTTEIQTLLQVLRILDNLLQDIPLYGVMRSYFGGFSEEEIAGIKAAYRENGSSGGTLYEQVVWFAGAQQDAKASAFLAWIIRFRQKAVYTPIQDLLRELVVDSGYYHFVTVQPAGDQRRANVEMLLTKAAAFAQTSYYGLFHFIRYIEQLKKYDVDYGEANILDEHADVVRLMSIHKSKGLEFPICFVAGLSKRFNMQDLYGSLVVDIDMGIGVDYVDTECRLQSKSLRKCAIAQKLKLDSLGEEIRILYVAMTRAKEKLILTGTMKNPEISQNPETSKNSEQVSFLDLAEAGSYLDFLLPALADSRAPDYFDIHILEAADLLAEEIRETVESAAKRRRLLLEEPAADTGRLAERFARSYSHTALAALYAKTTVSELKKSKMVEREKEEIFTAAFYAEPEIVPYIPGFMKGEEDITGTVRGSAYHKVMELLDFAVLAPDTMEQYIQQQMTDSFGGRLPQEYRGAVGSRKILTFLQTALGRRMMAAARRGKLFKEQPFVIGLPADRLDGDFPAEEIILIQGIIDVFLEEDGELVVMDYKTDAVKTEKELVDRYQKQLDYYAEALEQLTGKKVKEKVIYSFGLNKEIMIGKDRL